LAWDRGLIGTRSQMQPNPALHGWSRALCGMDLEAFAQVTGEKQNGPPKKGTYDSEPISIGRQVTAAEGALTEPRGPTGAHRS